MYVYTRVICPPHENTQEHTCTQGAGQHTLDSFQLLVSPLASV